MLYQVKYYINHSLFLSNVKLAAPGPVTQLDCPLADEDGDDEDDQPPQQAHTLRHQLRGEADERKPDIIFMNYSYICLILHWKL